ncbi:hypothetical protein DICPUDRAFT_158438 [Dictyostelium purpureum]|uniref:Cell division cycle protein 123 homolog n=1 Tax=Dictyostelium purpureum TaxID=5786 RepID=F1A1M2_DICPU|nr:uncharacterized protein DICPUDRAFT_158438 [Dictyostelium purpureum]EGC29907.1 hypothetical protein DICPUDRAFT_158438 [Dictyostelium purpureum]|eukprot:XP_003293568.1 hypothetical protein DICPUDRAFT_158438 [Dictyostelium purpureum]
MSATSTIDKFFENKKQCQFQNWYDKFKAVTFSSVIIPLPKIFIDYLQSDDFSFGNGDFPEFRVEDNDLLDDNNWSTPTTITKPDPKYYQSNSDNEEESDDDDDDDEEEEENSSKNKRVIKQTDFPELLDKIKTAIEKMGGTVIPKLNWSAPKDAIWMNTYNSLKCTTPTDIFLLLKSSDYINHDLLQYKIKEEEDDNTTTPFVLVLRKWQNLHPSMEFRCYVKDNKLIGISQRDTSTYFNFLKDKKDKILNAIINFYDNSIKEKFNSSSFTFDCYVTKDDKVWVIDFNPIHPSTESLLFLWDELFPELIEDDEESLQAKKEDPIKEITELEFRIVQDENSIKPNLSMKSRLPLELMNLSNSDNINELLQQFNDQNKK